MRQNHSGVEAGLGDAVPRFSWGDTDAQGPSGHLPILLRRTLSGSLEIHASIPRPEERPRKAGHECELSFMGVAALATPGTTLGRQSVSEGLLRKIIHIF